MRAALIDLVYAALGLAGAASLLEVEALRSPSGSLGALVLGRIGARTCGPRSGSPRGEAEEEVATPRRAFPTAVAATASNPLTIATWAAIFTAASRRWATRPRRPPGRPDARRSRSAPHGVRDAVATVTLVRSRFGPRLLAAVDAVAGIGLLGFAGLRLARRQRLLGPLLHRLDALLALAIGVRVAPVGPIDSRIRS